MIFKIQIMIFPFRRLLPILGVFAISLLSKSMPSNKSTKKTTKSQQQQALDQQRKAAKKAMKQAGNARAIQKLKAGCSSRGNNGVDPNDPMYKHCNY